MKWWFLLPNRGVYHGKYNGESRFAFRSVDAATLEDVNHFTERQIVISSRERQL